jgi:hypothetical protein
MEEYPFTVSENLIDEEMISLALKVKNLWKCPGKRRQLSSAASLNAPNVPQRAAAHVPCAAALTCGLWLCVHRLVHAQ